LPLALTCKPTELCAPHLLVTLQSDFEAAALIDNLDEAVYEAVMKPGMLPSMKFVLNRDHCFGRSF